MKFQKLSGLDNFKDKKINVQGEMPITLADAFESSEKRVDEINKKLDERQKEIDKFVKETEDKKNYKLTLPEEDRKQYKKMGLIENLSKMSRKELKEALNEDYSNEIFKGLKNNLDGFFTDHDVEAEEFIDMLNDYTERFDHYYQDLKRPGDHFEDESLQEKECLDCKEQELKEEKNKKPLWKKRGWDLFERVYANLIRTTQPSEKNDEVPDTKRGCRYEYDELGYDKDGSIILENEDEEYFDFAKKVVDYFSKFGVKMEGPKPSLKNDKILIARIIIPEEEIRDTVKYEDD